MDDESPVAQSDSSVGLSLNEDSQREVVDQLTDEDKGSEKTVDNNESATAEWPAASVKLEFKLLYLFTHCYYIVHTSVSLIFCVEVITGEKFLNFFTGGFLGPKK